MSASLTALVPAAGVGVRAGSPDGLPKQYRDLGGEPMLRHAVRALLADSRIAQVRVAVAPGDSWADAALAGLPRTVLRRCGGPTRAETVRAALRDADLAAGAWVLVHDAARPGLPADALARLIDACLAQDRGGLLALPVADTVKQAGEASCGPAWVDRTLPRDGLWLAQTPQMFRYALLRQALTAATDPTTITDDASAVEALGLTPKLVEGHPRNLKVTLPDDIRIAELYLAVSQPEFV